MCQLEDLEQIVSNPSSILSDILGMMAARGGGEGSSGGGGLSSSRIGAGDSFGFGSTTVSTTQTTTTTTTGGGGVTHLGVVGRGVKRVSMSTTGTESSPAKKVASDPTADNDAT